MTLTTGIHLNHYEILSLLGEGGMGEVYLAQDLRLKRKVAIKLLPAELTRDADRVRRFEQEAQAASALNHPNIITIYDIGESEAGRFIVMEFVEGRTLKAIAQERPAIDSIVAWGGQIAKALGAAHEAGIIHRDIKPENIMVRPDGYVKVLDFGLARLAPATEFGSESATLQQTQPGALLGTVAYMSPEQARSEKLTNATDVFSFGVVLYELVARRHPFDVTTLLGALQAITERAPAVPSKLNPEISPRLEDLILRMLDKDPLMRPAAKDVEASLFEIERGGERQSGRISQPAVSLTPASARRTVGREKERAELRAGFAAANAGRGSLLCVAGEPGMGKTTLVEEFLAECAEGYCCAVARGRCSERLAGTEAYLPWLEALDSLLRDDDQPSEARTMYPGGEPLAQKLRRIAPTWYAQIAPISDDNPSSARLMEELHSASQERLKRELAAMLEEVSRTQALVIFFDDLHWADVSTIDLLTFLGGRLPEMRVLVVTTYRPSDMQLAKHPFLRIKPDLQARGVCREIALEFLSRADVEKYLALEFPGHRFPPELPSLIYSKTEGNPLFMADLTRYLRERRVIAEEQGRWALARSLHDIERDLPESVRAMIERKISQLGEEDRRLLTAASVQGYEFDSAVVAQSLGLDAGAVEERLEYLERVHTFVRLVEEREFPDHTLTLRYRFVHALYQNALYAGLRPTRRTQLAGAVARTMEAYWGEKSAHVANELAALWESARDFARAADYFRVAANNASQVFATQEAVELAQRGLAMSMMMPENRERIERELSLQLILGNGLIATSGYASTGVEQAYARAHELCQQHGEIPHSLPVLYGLYAVHLVRGNLRRALELGEEFMNLAVRQDDPAVIVAHNLLGYPLFYMGQIAQARERFEQSLACYDPARHRPLTWLYGAEPGMAARTFVALAWWILGYPDRALTESREALRWAKETPHDHSHAFAMYYAAAIHLYRREPERLLEVIEPAITLASEQGLALWAASGISLRGWARVQMGESDDAIDELRRGLNNLKATGTSLGVFERYCLLAEAYGKIGRVGEGLAALRQAQTLRDEGEERFWEVEMHRLRGDLLLRDGAATEEAESCYRQAISVAQRQQAKSFELRAVMGLCRLWRDQGKRDEARARLADIYNWFTEGFDTTDLKEARALLDELA